MARHSGLLASPSPNQASQTLLKYRSGTTLRPPKRLRFSGRYSVAGRTSIRSVGSRRQDDLGTAQPAPTSGCPASAKNRESNARIVPTRPFWRFPTMPSMSTCPGAVLSASILSWHDDSCWFVAADFDGTSWREDAMAYAIGLPGARKFLPTSRSHALVKAHTPGPSSSRPIPVAQARQLASAAITRACARHRTLAFASYDRLFPSQDTLPKGGFGNLIALPLQRKARDHGASVFVDDAWRPYPDQWAFLAAIERMTPMAVDAALARAASEDGVLGVRAVTFGDDAIDDPWTLPPSRRQSEPQVVGPLPDRVEVVSANMLFIAKHGLPERMINRLSRLAAFQNPEFYQAQSLRFSTFGKPRIIGCAEEFPNHLALPRGCADEVMGLLRECGTTVKLEDKRHAGHPDRCPVSWRARPGQSKAVEAVLAHEIGVLLRPDRIRKDGRCRRGDCCAKDQHPDHRSSDAAARSVAQSSDYFPADR